MEGLKVGSIVMHQGKRKKIMEIFNNYDFISTKGSEYFYVLKCMDTEIIMISKSDDIELILKKEDHMEPASEKDKTFKYNLGDIVKCEKNGRIATVVNTSKAVRDRYKLEFYDGYTMWVYSYEMSLVGSNVTAKDDYVELSKEDYYSILGLAVDLGDKDLLDTYKDKVNDI